jgi:hypothetical protein
MTTVVDRCNELMKTPYFASIFANESDTPDMYSDPLGWMCRRASNAALSTTGPCSLQLHFSEFDTLEGFSVPNDHLVDFVIDLDKSYVENGKTVWSRIKEAFPMYTDERIKASRFTLMVSYVFYWDDETHLHWRIQLDRGREDETYEIKCMCESSDKVVCRRHEIQIVQYGGWE